MVSVGELTNKQARIAGQATTEALVEEAQIKAGMHVLDLASGAGNPALKLEMVCH